MSTDSGVENPSEKGPVGPGWFRGLRSGWSTVFLVGAVATASQLAAVSMAGLELAPGTQTWSSGGLVALIGGLLMWKFAKTWHDFRKWIWLPLVVVATLSFLVVGATNNYDVEIVDQEARAATQSMQPTGAFHVFETAERICEPWDDYLYCLNAHVASYNSVCANQTLSIFGSATCSSMSRFIEQMRSSYEGCGYGCTVGGEVGKWGRSHLRLEAATAMKSNNDAQPRRTHTEHCSFDLGIIQIGTCAERGQ